MFAHNVLQLEQTYQTKHLICKPDIQACTDLRRCFPLEDLWSNARDWKTLMLISKKKTNVCTPLWKPKNVQGEWSRDFLQKHMSCEIKQYCKYTFFPFFFAPKIVFGMWNFLWKPHPNLSFVWNMFPSMKSKEFPAQKSNGDGSTLLTPSSVTEMLTRPWNI